jgi:hypothetical protein
MGTYKFLVLVVLLSLTGCGFIRNTQINTPTAIVLPEDKIYTIKAGTTVADITLDGKQIGPISFGNDMKLVSSETLVKQEVEKNNAITGKMEAEVNGSKMTVIFSSIICFLTALVGIWIRFRGTIDTSKKT